MAEAAEKVARTNELSHHITVPGGDDLGRLATTFNTMLDALSDSLAQQRQLVADASHELRTPLATVRTNVEVLARADELPAEERAELIRDTVAQIGELTRLVGDLVELARGDGQEEPFTVVDLDELTRGVVEVVGRNHPAIVFRVDGAPSLVRGAPGRVARAVSNLVDNAAKWSPPGSEVEITVRDGIVTVRDHGPGVDPTDLPHVFNRFYRSPEARTMPGSAPDSVWPSSSRSPTATAAPSRPRPLPAAARCSCCSSPQWAAQASPRWTFPPDSHPFLRATSWCAHAGRRALRHAARFGDLRHRYRGPIPERGDAHGRYGLAP